MVEGGSEIKPTEVKVPSSAIYFRDKKDKQLNYFQKKETGVT